MQLTPVDEQKKVQSQFRQQQQKYTYYIMVLCVTAIGFSIYITIGEPLKYSQIPLALALACWGVSVYCGFLFISYGLSVLFVSDAYFEVKQGRFPDVGSHPQKIETASKGLQQAMDFNSERGGIAGKWQNRLFFSGIIFFIGWHVWEMYVKMVSI